MSSCRVLLGVLLLALFYPPRVAAEQERDRALTNGLSLGLGVGHENAGIGGHLIYYVQLTDEYWRIAPHMGVGWFVNSGGAGGVMVSFGHHYRAVIDLVGGLISSEIESTDYTAGGSRPWARGREIIHVHYGIATLVGFEWMAAFGLALRSTVGVSYQPAADKNERVFLGINILSVDYKLR